MSVPREETKLDLLAGLNSPQQEAVTHGEGPLLILAGPGSGKTRVITHRIAYLLREQGVPPWSVLAVTFTNKAAREMRERLDRLVGARARDLTIGTFHAICARILRREGDQTGIIPSNFAIFDDDDQATLAKQAVLNLDLNDKQYQPRAMLSAISKAKNELLGPLQFAEQARKYYDEIVARVYKEYQRLLQQNNAVDFDDLILLTHTLWRQHPDVLERYQARYRFLHIDEFQDTNIAQYKLVMMLGKGTAETPGHRNVCVVGDEDQGIYSWRGADVRNILEFERDFPDARVILLEQNYRSTQPILDAARQVVQHNLARKDKRLWTDKSGGERIMVHEAYDEEEEGQWVVNEIRRLVARGQAKLRDCAVMYRTNAQSRALEEQFIRAGVPYQVIGSRRFYERKEIKDMLAYLRLLLNPSDTFSLKRIINVPNRKIGPKTQDELLKWADAQKLPVCEALRKIQDHPTLNTAGKRALAEFCTILDSLLEAAKTERLHDLIERILIETSYRQKELSDSTEEGEERLRNVRELQRVAMDYSEIEPGTALPLFLEQVALVGGADVVQTGGDDHAGLAQEDADAVTLITLHAAKGLEFPVVFIVGMEEGLLPHGRSLMDIKQLEEERRLAYVGITRAMMRLYLLRAFRRTFYGSFGEAGGSVMEPSRFLLDIPDHLVDGRKSMPRGPSTNGPLGRSVPGGATLGEPISNRSRGGWSARASGPGGWGYSSQIAREMTGGNGANGAAPPGGKDSSSDAPADPQFEPGDRVKHRVYGTGTIVKSIREHDNLLVEVDFGERFGKKMLDVSFARLEKI
ncbi:MAG TPA: UvrD-helicase domain-containing protein [Ktedonobacterales bacterium]|nr:UvrD-helicase domain-containing protein [Ktedonobacterales bacterium]